MWEGRWREGEGGENSYSLLDSSEGELGYAFKVNEKNDGHPEKDFFSCVGGHKGNDDVCVCATLPNIHRVTESQR